MYELIIGLNDVSNKHLLVFKLFLIPTMTIYQNTTKVLWCKIYYYLQQKISFIDVATGSLGQGINIACGMAYTAKYVDKTKLVYSKIGKKYVKNCIVISLSFQWVINITLISNVF